MDEVRVGVIGVGSRGRTLSKNMAQRYQEAGLRVVAISDLNPDTMATMAETIAQQFAENGAAETAVRCYDNGHDLIAAEDVELILVTTLSDSHAEFVVPALATGKHVYCDKPLAHTAEDCVRIVEAEAKEGNPVVMGFTRRYETTWRKAADLVADGVIGDVEMVLVRDIIPYSRYLSGWWRRRAVSGGALNDKGSHLFDVMNWMIGDHPVAVHAFGTRSIAPVLADTPSNCRICERDCDYRQRIHDPQAFEARRELPINCRDNCILNGESDAYHGGTTHFKYPNDVLATYVYDFLGFNTEDEETLEVVGDRGKLVLCRAAGTIDVVADFGRKQYTIDSKGDLEGSHFGADLNLMLDIRRFCDGHKPVVGARDGLEATRMVVASLMSMDVGGRVVQMSEVPNACI